MKIEREIHNSFSIEYTDRNFSKERKMQSNHVYAPLFLNFYL